MDLGEGDCDGPGDGGQHDGNSGCKAGLVCGSNNCFKYGAYFHPKDDCCEKPDGSGGKSWFSVVKRDICTSCNKYYENFSFLLQVGKNGGLLALAANPAVEVIKNILFSSKSR